MPRSTRRAEARKQIKNRRWRLPPVSISQILAWADEHFEQTGRWPNTMSGRVRGTFEEKWKNLDNALRQGTRGLLKGDSLAKRGRVFIKRCITAVAAYAPVRRWRAS